MGTWDAAREEEQKAYNNRRYKHPEMGWLRIAFFSGKGTGTLVTPL
jgi:hypothetical protein